jgi:hypothetical protein
MEWALDHLQVLIFVAIAVAAVFQRLKKANDGAGAGPAAAPADPEEEARTRRIQEEIRRRIMERRGLAPSPQPASGTAPEPPRFPTAPPLIEEVRSYRVEPPAEAAAEAPDVQRAAAELKRQQELAERVRELDAARHARAAVATESAKIALEAAANRPLPDLRSPSGLRRAIVLREVLGPPVGLR